MIRILMISAVLFWGFFTVLLVPVNALESASDYMEKADAAFHAGDYDAAIQNYTLAIGAAPSESRAYFNRGSAYMRKGEWDKAIQNYDDAVNIDPNFLQSYNYRALAYYRKGQFQKCADELKKVEALGGTPDPSLVEELRKQSQDKRFGFVENLESGAGGQYSPEQVFPAIQASSQEEKTKQF